MKILLVYPNLGGSVGFNIGLAVLAAALKQHGHEVRLLHLNEELGHPLDFDDIFTVVAEFTPDVFGVSSNTNQFQVAVSVARQLKSRYPEVPMVFGGIHPTLNPERTLAHDCVDFVVVGEGESAFVDLLAAIANGGPTNAIKNVWTRSGEDVNRTPLRPYVDLSSLPFMDVGIYEYQKIIDSRNGWVDVLLGRGCPFKCRYCFNQAYRETYKEHCGGEGAGRYVRSCDHEHTLEGIERLVSDYKRIKCVSFVDDNLLLYPTVGDFLELFKKRIDLPFVLNTHVQSIKPDSMAVLRDSGCDLVRVGVECGNPDIRRHLLARDCTDEDIINAMTLVRSYHIRSFTYNMIGLPTETRQDVLRTLELNVRCAPDVVKVSTFYPYKGTRLFESCEQLGLLAPDFQEDRLTYFERSVLDLPPEFSLFLSKVQKHFDCYLNSFIPEAAKAYVHLLDWVNQLEVEEWETEECQNRINTEKSAISERLTAEGITHYTMKYTAYFAVRTAGEPLIATQGPTRTVIDKPEQVATQL